MDWSRTVGPTKTLRHEALLYEGEAAFLESSVPFIREGVRAGEAVLVMVDEPKIARLSEALGEDAQDVFFEDIRETGANPGRLIAHWRRFASAHPDSPALRGIGEPISAERDEAGLDECRRHEALLNVALDDDLDIWLLCAYDIGALPRPVVEAARTTHPVIAEAGAEHASDRYAHAAGVLAGELSPPPAEALTVSFGPGDAREVRMFADSSARDLGLAPDGIESLVFAASELAANTVRHGGGHGTIAVWAESGAVVLEVRDSGRLHDPLVGRLRPGVDDVRGRGLWLVNQLCDLVQIRSGTNGTVVRVRVA